MESQTFRLPTEPLVVIQPSKRWSILSFKDIWAYRELLFFLTWRDVKVRYKQTALGAAWAILQPLFMMIIFTIFFGRLAGVASAGVPYPLFALAGLVPWTFFSNSITASGNSLVGSANLITKVYFQQTLYMSATPGPYELRVAKRIAEQIVRPTGLVDPEVQVRPTKGQVDDLIEEIRKRAEASQRVLVTTLTKKMAEDLTGYLLEMGIRVRYLHSEVDTIQRIEIIRDLRLGEFDVLVGINLLREGLDLPEVSLVAILDADKEGFLRSETSLIQTIGRAARNVDGTVIMYADQSRTRCSRRSARRNAGAMIQIAYNREHGIDPQTIRKKVSDILLTMSLDAAGRRRPRSDVESATSPRCRAKSSNG